MYEWLNFAKSRCHLRWQSLPTVRKWKWADVIRSAPRNPEAKRLYFNAIFPVYLQTFQIISVQFLTDWHGERIR